MISQSFLLADFLADNAMPILGLMASVLVAVLGGVIHLVIAIAKLNTTTQFLKEKMDDMGKASVTSRDSVREEVEKLKVRVNGFEVALARCTPGQAH